MKLFVVSIVIAAVICVPMIFGVLPAIIGGIAMLMFVLVKDLLLAVFMRGPPMEIVKVRMSGGILWAVAKRTRELVIARFHPKAGMIQTKEHGAFNVMPGRLYSLGGVLIGIAPEKVGYNVGIDHAAIVDELKKRGINDIREVCDLDEFGQIKGFKDDKRIKDLIDIKPEQVSFDDFYKYTAEAANPIHQDANIKLGISQGLLGKEVGKYIWLVFAGFGVLLACIGVWLLLSHSGGSQEPIRIIIDNAGNVIPV